ncbi:unnamed protein product [Sphenostylis stenocarpa]|uniref:Uncharacterized protein n=1 Tax=Sphenostylis stenocarpa TaxID=92480 RepID=A0AA86SRX2_9FABA|nr:unnamed protein product [Sphenostylis stenocarpa]
MQFNASTLPMPSIIYTLLKTHLVNAKISGLGSHGDQEAQNSTPSPSAVGDCHDDGFAYHELSTHRWKGLQRLHCKPDEKRLSILHYNTTLHGSLLVGWQFKAQLHQEMQQQRRLPNTLRLQEMHVQVQVQLCQLAHLPHQNDHTIYHLSYLFWLLNCVFKYVLVKKSKYLELVLNLLSSKLLVLLAPPLCFLLYMSYNLHLFRICRHRFTLES